MSELSSHTKLMNTIICLSTKSSSRYCTPILYQNHYELETIECTFNKINGDLIDIDIILKNPELNNLVFVECKAGGLENSQAQRYSSLTKEDIVNASITTLGGDFSFEITYLTDAENKDKLVQGISESSLNFPVIFQNGNTISLAHNSISCQTLHNLFTNNGGIIVPENPPLTYYPFGKDDSDAHILGVIGPALMKLRGQEFDVVDILSETHNIDTNYLSETAIKSLKTRVGKLISQMSKGDMSEFFSISTSSKQFALRDLKLKRFQTKLEKYIEKSDQRPLKETQLSLGNFTEKGDIK
jgi:hypothetical protein